MPNENIINQRIKDLRVSRNVPQKEMAELLGVKVSTYSQMERKGTIPAEKLKRIANFFCVDYAVLLDGEIPKTTPTLNRDVRMLCDIITKELEKQMKSRYCFLHNFSNVELEFIRMITCLPKKKRTAVYEYARDLLKNKTNI